MNIIALMGWKGSGKDTVANYLENNYNFIHLKFARYIKDAANCLFPNIPLSDIENKYLDDLDYWEVDKDTPREELGGFTKREVLVDLAQHLKSKYGENIFVNNINREISLLNQNSNIIISDLRFIVELEWLFSLLNIHNINILNVERENIVVEKYTDYLSLIRLIRQKENFKNYRHIDNTSTIEDLYKRIDRLLITKIDF